LRGAGPGVRTSRVAERPVVLERAEEGIVMQPDYVADPGVPPPDHIPEDILERYGSQARHTVRYHRSRRYRFSTRFRRAGEPMHDAELWSVTALVFFWAVAGLGILGGIGYAVFLWPQVGLSILGAMLALLGLSVLIAMRVTRRG
jgi:hypothetical protein